MSATRTTLSPALVEELVASACRAHPAESCAIGLGARPGDVAELVHVANTATDPHRGFRIDDVTLTNILADGRTRGLELTLVAHSHPSGDPRRSVHDIASAGDWPGVAHAIVTVEGEVQLHD